MKGSGLSRARLRQECRRQIDLARKSMLPDSRTFQIRESGKSEQLTVVREGVGPLQTDWGVFTMYSFRLNDQWGKYSALVRAAEVDDDFAPRFSSPDGLLVRIDSGCETGQVFQDLTCECRDQLHKAMEALAQFGEGVIVNIPAQDGRGLGLPFKLATLRLQDELDHDTVEAAALLELDGARDTRTYSGAIAVLRALQILPGTVIRLATNNPKKTAVFTENGYAFEYHPIVVEPTVHTTRHLAAKQAHLGHIGLVVN